LANRKSVKSYVIYLTKSSPRSISLSRSYADRAQNYRGQRQTTCLEWPKFHPNRFTYGGVIAERVNTVETHHKVFPIGRSLASSRIITQMSLIRGLTAGVWSFVLGRSAVVAVVDCRHSGRRRHHTDVGMRLLHVHVSPGSRLGRRQQQRFRFRQRVLRR